MYNNTWYINNNDKNIKLIINKKNVGINKNDINIFNNNDDINKEKKEFKYNVQYNIK